MTSSLAVDDVGKLGDVRSMWTAGRLDHLDALRAVAALAVCWFHFTSTHADLLGNGMQVGLGAYGYLGVQAFFVISGFVIPFAAERFPEQKSVWQFLGRRLARLTPPFWAAIVLVPVLWAISFLLGFAPTAPPINLGTALSNGFYLAEILQQPWMNPVFWSLAIEIQFYLFSLIFIAGGLREIRSQLFYLALAVAGPLLLANHAFLLTYLPFFAFGALAYLRGSGNASGARVVVATMVLIPVCWFTHGLAATLVALATMVAVLYGGRISAGWLARLGVISYSLYLIHVPVGGRIMNLAARMPDASWVQAAPAVALIVSIIVSVGFFVAIEKPSIRLSRRV